MHLRTLAIALAVLGLFAASPALAKNPHRYTLHGKHCKRGYRKAHRPHKTFCVKRPARKGAAHAEKVKLHAHLDPSYTRNPLDPFEVTYAYSASATQEPLAGRASISTEEPASLPSGVLAFYSDGKLECAVNVGGSASGSACPVDYQALGEHRVTTIYSSGEQSATETESEQIGPIPTNTQLTASYKALPVPSGGGAGWTLVGTLTAQWGATPSLVHAHLGCDEEPSEAFGRITPSHCYVLAAADSPVYAWVQGECDSPELVYIWVGELPGNNSPPVHAPSVSEIEEGVLHLRASVQASNMTNVGYGPSEATTPLQFRPEGPASIC